MPVEMDPRRFDALVDEALDGIPDELAALVRNVVVLVEDEPPDDDPRPARPVRRRRAHRAVRRLGMPSCPTGSSSSAARCSTCATTEEELVDEVRITVVHEVAHHFGIDDDRLHDLGYA